MITKQRVIISKNSRLEQFALSFEYDKTLQQVKHDMKIRTMDKNP
jgi:hypothetical protein